MRERGLKQVALHLLLPFVASLLMRERGLKPISLASQYEVLVAPYAGAWIETPNARSGNLELGRRSLCGSVD